MMAGLSSHQEEPQAAASRLLNHLRMRIFKLAIVTHGESSCLTPSLFTLDEYLKMVVWNRRGQSPTE